MSGGPHVAADGTVTFYPTSLDGFGVLADNYRPFVVKVREQSTGEFRFVSVVRYARALGLAATEYDGLLSDRLAHWAREWIAVAKGLISLG